MKITTWITVLSTTLLAHLAHANNHSFFRVGANIADWECRPPKFCNYSHDIGNNYWEKENLPGFEWRANFRPELWEKVFRDLNSAGANTARIPLMTEGQGIIYENRISMKSVDPVWLENIVKILDLAQKYGIQVDAGIMLGNVPLKKGYFSYYWGQQILIKSPARIDFYLQNIVGPLLGRIANHPALWSIDVLGEADGLLTEHKGEVTEEHIRYFVSRSVRFIKQKAPHILLTASTGYNKHIEPKAIKKLLSGLGLDFYDVHLYNQTGEIEKCAQWPKLDLPVVLGEYGLKQPSSNDPSGQATRNLQSAVANRFTQNAKRCGFIGAIAWLASPGSSANPELDRFQNLYTGQGTFKVEFRNTFHQQ